MNTRERRTLTLACLVRRLAACVACTLHFDRRDEFASLDRLTIWRGGGLLRTRSGAAAAWLSDAQCADGVQLAALAACRNSHFEFALCKRSICMHHLNLRFGAVVAVQRNVHDRRKRRAAGRQLAQRRTCE